MQHPLARRKGDVCRGKGHPPVARSLGPFAMRGPAWRQHVPVGKYCILPVPAGEVMKKHMEKINPCSQFGTKILAGTEGVYWHVDPCTTHAGEPREC